jgi:hypothetical protein
MQKEPLPNDKIIIAELLAYFKNNCVQPGKKINDRSSIAFAKVFNNNNGTSCNETLIDLDDHLKLAEKQDFVNHGLDKAISNFKNQVDLIYKGNNKGGLDLLSFLHEKISSGKHLKQNKMISNGKDTTFFHYNNHVIIFTDGYLEFSMKNDYNKCFYFSIPEIKQIRDYCIKNNLTTREAFLKNDKLPRLKALKCDNNKFVNLYIMETADRDFQYTQKTGSHKYPMGLQDNDILKAVWQLWAEESGFRTFTWHKQNVECQYTGKYISALIKN